MKINWTVRLKNPIWWVQIVLAMFTPILAYAGITAADITTWKALGDLLLGAISNTCHFVSVQANTLLLALVSTNRGHII